MVSLSTYMIRLRVIRILYTRGVVSIFAYFKFCFADNCSSNINLCSNGFNCQPTVCGLACFRNKAKYFFLIKSQFVWESMTAQAVDSFPVYQFWDFASCHLHKVLLLFIYPFFVLFSLLCDSSNAFIEMAWSKYNT
jgi:hypothetical protein